MSRAARRPLTAERLRELLHYDPDTGVFTRLVATGGRYRADVGDVAGTDSDQGYILISVESYQYRAHRLAWLYMTGGWPQHEVDHRDAIRSNNRWGNLRDVTPKVNQQNLRKAQKNSKTGLLGASWCKRHKRFVARLYVGKKYRSLGYFESAELAHAAYVQAKRRHHEGCTI